jgi:hypothetical protein
MPADPASTADDAVRAISRQESRGSLALWFGVLGSPAAWLGHLGLNYSLEEWFACSPATTDRGEILGFGVDAVSLVLNTVMALVAAAAGLTALACWRKLRAATDGNTLERAQWMAFAGTVEGAVFLGMILLGYLPPLILDTCATTP